MGFCPYFFIYFSLFFFHSVSFPPREVGGSVATFSTLKHHELYHSGERRPALRTVRFGAGGIPFFTLLETGQTVFVATERHRGGGLVEWRQAYPARHLGGILDSGGPYFVKDMCGHPTGGKHIGFLFLTGLAR